MSASKIRADYEQLAQIAQGFGQAADQSRQTLQALQSQMSTLQSGDWVGKSADKMYAEMNSALLPTMKRLVSALERAKSVTQQVSRVMKQAEDESAALFKGAASGVASGNGAGGAAGGAGGSSGGSGGSTSGSSGGSSGGSGGSGSGSSGGSSGQPGNNLLARDPNSLFKDDYMKSLIDSKFQGADSKELKNAMNELSRKPPPTGAELDATLAKIAEARGRPVSEIKAEYDKFLQIKAQRDATNPNDPVPDLKFPHGSFQGSTSQMRYGKVVGDAFGVDPVFGSLLNPTGGMVGPGNVAFDADSTAVGYHGIVHDAAGYLHNYHKTGPGYDYLGRENRDTSDPLSGQREGIKYWRETLGDYSNVREVASLPITGLPVSQSSEYVMRGVVFAADTWNKVKSFF